jgi:hypothetical protein
MSNTFFGLAFDVADAADQATFWAQATGGRVEDGATQENAVVSGSGFPRLAGYVHVALPDGVAGDPSDGRHVVNDAGWFYPIPYKPVADIAGHIAFYPDSVQITAHDPVDDLDWTDRSVRSPDVDHD